MKKRACFYIFKSDIKRIDEYSILFLTELRKVSNYVEVICPKALNNSENKKIFGLVDRIEVGSLQERLAEQWEGELKDYEEFILCDDTFMGFVYPLHEMLEYMEEKKVKAWNILPVEDSFVDGFCVLSNDMVQAVFLNSMHCFRETVLRQIEKMGEKIDSYIDLSLYQTLTKEPLLLYPAKIMKEQRCPVFDFRVFSEDYFDVLEVGTGRGARELYEFLKRETSFDLNVLWDKLLRDVNQADFVKNLNLNYVLSSNEPLIKEEYKQKVLPKTALVMHLYYLDLISKSLAYAESVPETTDVYITTDTEEKKREIEKNLRKLLPRNCQVRLIPNRGRDVSSLLVGVKDIISKYDYMCFVHDKKTTQVEQGSVGEGFATRIFHNTLCCRNYVQKIIDLFEKNERLGMLSPATPNHSDYFVTLGQEWGVNYENTANLAKQLQLDVPMSRDKEPVAPFGTCFWFRTKALQPLYAKDWKYEDFPEEPNGTDGTILHAIERIYPYVVQSAGYYPAFVLEQRYAELDLTNLQFYIRNYNSLLLNHGYGGRVKKMCMQLEQNLDGGETPVHKILEEYKDAHDRVNEEWRKTAEALVQEQKKTQEYKNAHDRVNEEWRKTAEALKKVNEEWKKTAEALKQVNCEYGEIQKKYAWTIRGIIERLIHLVGRRHL